MQVPIHSFAAASAGRLDPGRPRSRKPHNGASSLCLSQFDARSCTMHVLSITQCAHSPRKAPLPMHDHLNAADRTQKPARSQRGSASTGKQQNGGKDVGLGGGASGVCVQILPGTPLLPHFISVTLACRVACYGGSKISPLPFWKSSTSNFIFSRLFRCCIRLFSLYSSVSFTLW